MKVKTLLFSTLLFSLLLHVYAAPLQDISVTSVDLSEESINTNNKNSNGDEHLYVTVTRVDDLVDDDGSILAERVMAVKVTFDVVENQVRCNGVPIEIGVSNIQVQAQMSSNPNKLTVDSPEELALLQDSFDVGLANVEVTATLMDQFTTPEGITFRRISVTEKITEINNQKVVQTEAGQQVLDIFENGKLNKYTVDPLTGFLLPADDNIKQLPVDDDDFIYVDGPIHADDDYDQKLEEIAPTSNGCATLLDPLVQWWHQQSGLTRVTITGAIAALLFGIGVFILQLVASANRSYEALPLVAYEDDETIYDKDDETIYEKNPPAYQHDEKEPLV